MAGEPLHLVFDRRTHPDAAARCEKWRDAFSLSVDTVFATDEIESFEASTRFRSLGPVLLADSRYTSHTVVRDRCTIARTGSEQVILDVFVGGGFSGRVGGRSCLVAPGDVFLMDMSGTFKVRLNPGRFVGLIMPRALFEGAVGSETSVHGLVLPADSPPAQVLGAVLVAAADRMLELSPALAEAIGPALVATVAACLVEAIAGNRPAPARSGKLSITPRRAKPTVALLSRHIRRHAADPLYDAATMARAFGLSRAALYRLFQKTDGIEAAIRRRRAEVALRLLQDNKSCTFLWVAQRSGFSNERALRRALAVTYGATPGTLRRLSERKDKQRPSQAIDALFDEMLL